MPVRAVTLDGAGTLCAPAEPVAATYARIAARHGIRAAPRALEAGFRRALGAAPALAFPSAHGEELDARERAWWARVVRGAFGALADMPGFGDCFAALFAHYAEPAAWRVFPEVPTTLQALRARGLRVGVVSNFDSRLPPLLAGLGLAPLLDAVVHSTAVGAAKPDPRIFRAALAALDAPAAEAVHAGDDAVADVGGARAAGLFAVLVRRDPARGAPPAGTLAVAALDGLLVVL